MLPLAVAVAIAARRLALLPRLADEGVIDAQGALDAGLGAAGARPGGGNKGDKVNINEPTKQVHRHRAQTHRHQCSPICGDTHADTHRNGPHGLKTISIILKSVN